MPSYQGRLGNLEKNLDKGFIKASVEGKEDYHHDIKIEFRKNSLSLNSN
jgi:hypothetical protein